MTESFWYEHIADMQKSLARRRPAAVWAEPVGRTKVRRTHAQRNAETREKIVTAAVACIAEHGFANASLLRIAGRAGVSLGSVQYQFGDKEGVVDAVLARAIDVYTGSMRGLREAAPALEQRVRAFTERAWVNFQGPHYRTILDILLHQPRRTQSLRAVYHSVWAELFGDLKLGEAQKTAARRFASHVLSGIALSMLAGVEVVNDDFKTLERVLLGMLSGRARAVGEAGKRGQIVTGRPGKQRYARAR